MPPAMAKGAFVMKLDSSFSREITKIANGDGSREAMFAFKKTTQQTSLALSNTKVATLFNDCIKTYGRVPVAICTAITVYARRDRLSTNMLTWALEVLKLWTNRPGSTDYAIINDGIHPTRIAKYAGAFIQVTTVDK